MVAVMETVAMAIGVLTFHDRVLLLFLALGTVVAGQAVRYARERTPALGLVTSGLADFAATVGGGLVLGGAGGWLVGKLTGFLAGMADRAGA